jgi:hypothetical protein
MKIVTAAVITVDNSVRAMFLRLGIRISNIIFIICLRLASGQERFISEC